MKPDQSHIKEIKAAFEKLQTREDLLALLNKTKPLLYGNKAVPFQLKQLTWYANPKLGRTRYKEFKILKKSGAQRSIHAPVKGLKALQRTLGFILQCVYEPHNATMGFVRNRSVLDNARLHVGSNYVYNIDLKDFFTSIDQARVWKCLQLKPFNLIEHDNIKEVLASGTSIKVVKLDYLPKSNQTIIAEFSNGTKAHVSLKGGFRKNGGQYMPLFCDETSDELLPEWHIVEVRGRNWITRKNKDLDSLGRGYSRKGLANLIASICCTEMEVERINSAGDWQMVKRNVLPQGAPSSPVLTNIVCQKLDFLLTAVAKRFGIKYSRYADDITFSSMHNVYQPGSEFLKELHRIIAEQKFQINESKTRLQKEGYRMEVTGLVVNEKPNVPQRYIKQIRMWLYYWERYGYEKSSGFFNKQYNADKGHLKNGQPDMANVISGKLEYLKLIKGQENALYKQLKSRFEKLTGNEAKQNNKDKEVTEIDITDTEEYLAVQEFNRVKLNLLTPDLLKQLLIDLIEKYNCINEDLLSPPDQKAKVAYTYYRDKVFNLIEEVKAALIFNQEEILISKTKNPLLNKQGDENAGIAVKSTGDEESIPVLHNPRKLVTLLKNFSANGRALKYTTHSWDAGRDAEMFKDLSQFLYLAETEYNKFSFALKQLSKNLNGKIYNFLFNKEISKTGWGDTDPKKRIYFGWSSPELLEACYNNISLNPEDFILPEKYQMQRSGKTLQKFKHIIDVFKNEIEVRDENSALLNLILQKHDKYLIDFSSPIIRNLENKSFYTDIQWLSKALDLIFEGIQKYPQHPVVEYAVIDNYNDKLVLNILQRNSFKRGLSIHDDKLNLKRGDFSDIKDKLKNLCDWCIESEFTEGAYRINYLVSDQQIPAYENIKTAEGFRHILTFYK